MSNLITISKVEYKIKELNQALINEIERRDDIHSSILDTYINLGFRVQNSNDTIEKIAELKTNNLTIILKEIHHQQTYLKQLMVEDMLWEGNK